MIARRQSGTDPRPSGMRGSIKPAFQLSHAFVEWMMGLPEGWVTSVDITRNEALKMLGNGVVPQQATAAIRHLVNAAGISVRTREAAA